MQLVVVMAVRKAVSAATTTCLALKNVVLIQRFSGQDNICAFFIHNEEKDMKIFGGYEIITYICSIKQIKQLDYARDTKNVWNEILFLFT